MNRLFFANNYNQKLHLDCFPTIRLAAPSRQVVGSEWHVFLMKNKIGKAVLIDVVPLPRFPPSDFICYLDAGMSAVQFVKMMCANYGGNPDELSSMKWNWLLLKWIVKYI